MISRPWRRCAQILSLTLLPIVQTLAQSEGAASAPDNRMERAQKAADAVFRWIKINADKPGVRPAAAPAASPAAPASAAAPAAGPGPSAAAPQRRQQPSSARVATSPAAPEPGVPAKTTAPSSPALPTAQSTIQPTTQGQVSPAGMLSASTVSAASAPSGLPTNGPAVPEPLSANTQPAVPATTRAEPELEPEPEVPLQLLSKVDPVMPKLPSQLRRDGYAQVQLTVEPDGHVSQAAVIKASHPRFGSAAVDAVRQWRFKPVSQSRDAAVEIHFNNDN